MKHDEIHLEIYEDRYELHQNDKTYIYYKGPQNIETQKRYEKINKALAEGYLEEKINSLADVDYSVLSDDNRESLKKLVNGITSQVGRGILGVVFLQLTIKSIAPEQSIRLHKGGNRAGTFSWVEGISMRRIDSTYITPFLRKHGLLNVNKDGVFMTRSLSENYPYTRLYKANMKGPFKEWIDMVDVIEDNDIPAEVGLCYLMTLLKKRSNAFNQIASQAVEKLGTLKNVELTEAKELLTTFFNKTHYSARAFEVVIHAFMQAMFECEYISGLELVPLSQMRSANKKHGNVGDVELKDGEIIIEAWDAKYGKPYLRNEIEELRDKILTTPGIKIAGFVVDCEVDKRKDVIDRVDEIAIETDVDIKLLSFEEWIEFKTKDLELQQKNKLALKWIQAVIESFAQKRTDIAQIDEPCEEWIKDIIECLN